MLDLGSGWGNTTGEPRRTEVTEAGGPSILSNVVAVSVVQGVEQVYAGGWEGVTGRESRTHNTWETGRGRKHIKPVTISFSNWKTQR
jgi:hypothetical protein